MGDLLATGADPTLISGVALDSRRVLPGDLYVALPGQATHGARFARAAVEAGAVAVLTDPAGSALLDGDLGVPLVVVADPRGELARLAAEVYGRPGDALLMLGVTGTAGKTSTAFLIEAGLAAAGLAAGTIGTMGFRVRGTTLPVQRSTITTPEAPDLQALLAVMREAGARAAATGGSPHPPALRRGGLAPGRPRGAPRAGARRLVGAGLGDSAPRHGERGWQFHDWAEYQPSRTETLARREQDRQRKAEARAALAAKREAERATERLI